MTGWFPFAVAALLLMGSQRFLYKVAVERSCNIAWTTLSFMGTVTAISAAAFFIRGAVALDIRFLLLVGLVNSLAFLAATVTHMEALKRLPAGIAYPLIRLDAVLVVLVSLLFFHDRVIARQWLGIILAVTAVLMIARQRGEGGKVAAVRGSGFLFVAIAVVAGTAAAVSSRFAALNTDKTAFIAVSYGLSSLFTIGLGMRQGRKDPGPGHGSAVLVGLAMGVLNVVGYYAYLEGLARGPLSLVTVTTSMHFAVSVILSMIIYRERLKPIWLAGILLTVVSLILLRA